MGDYIYLHGFASGPQSYKGQWLRSYFQRRGLDLRLLDFNQGDFAHLTLTRQINQVLHQIQGPTTLIGSSLGGLTAAWSAQQSTHIQRLILLAPAFQFLQQWLPRLGPEQLQHWKSRGWLSVYHYGWQRQERLHHKFLTDAHTYEDSQLNRPVPTLILHGKRDEIINIKASQHHGAHRPWITLRTLDTDHGMADAMETIGPLITDFCQL